MPSILIGVCVLLTLVILLSLIIMGVKRFIRRQLYSEMNYNNKNRKGKKKTVIKIFVFIMILVIVQFVYRAIFEAGFMMS